MKRLISVLLTATILLTACGSDRLDVDVSAISVPAVKIQRYDKAIFAIDTNAIPAGLAALEKEFGGFSTGFINNVVCRSGKDSLSRDRDIRAYLVDYSTRSVYDDCAEYFGSDFTWLETEITSSYKYFRFHFPKRPLPKAVVTDMTGFNYNILQIDGTYGIGLEHYLGSGNLYYDQLQWPAYIRENCRKEYMISNFVKGWMMNEFVYDPPKNDLINRMIYEGKILYLQKALLRTTADSIITGYSQKQLDWCSENEAKMWATLIEQNKLYSENDEDLQHYTQDAPFTPDFPRESPGKVGNWLGLRIVETYMEKNPTLSLEELMQQKDGQVILMKSKYKPSF